MTKALTQLVTKNLLTLKWHDRGEEVVNPGNTLYVTGLSTRVTERDLEDHFSKEGKVRFPTT